MDIVGNILLLFGALTVLLGALGLIRLPDFFARLHSASVVDSLAATLILIGLMLLSDDWLVVFKLALILFLLMLLAPVVSHSLGRLARRDMTRNQEDK